MSRRKIRNPNRKKKFKPPPISLRYVAMSKLAEERNTIKIKDSIKVEDLIISSKLDYKRITNYKYLQEVARNIGWSVGRLQKAIELTDVKTAIKMHEEEE